jgi:hypothetical protein
MAFLWAASAKGSDRDCNNVGAMKARAQSSPAKNASPKQKSKSGLPGTPETQRRELRAAMKKHDETLRPLAE